MTALARRPAGARWLYALKPASWPKLLTPCLLGQAIGVAAAGGFDARALLVGAAFTLAGLCFIVLLNDWGDREVDRLKRAMFPDGCSPKTIADGILPSAALLRAGLACGAAALLAAWLGAKWLQRPLLGWAGLGGMLVFCAYTLPPLQLNYRGGGELLEMLGVGFVLPWFNAYAQAGAPWLCELWVLPGFALLALASALASTLSDEQSDREGGKQTSATRFGNRATRLAVDGLVPAGLLAWALGAWLVAGARGVALIAPAVGVGFFHYRAQLHSSAAAITNAFAAQGRYKAHLHRAIGQGALLTAAALVVQWRIA